MTETKTETTDAVDLGSIFEDASATPAPASTELTAAPPAAPSSTAVAAAPSAQAVEIPDIAKPPRLVSLDRMPASAIEEAHKQAALINFADPNTMIAHGEGALKDLSIVADDLLNRRITGKIDVVGQVAIALRKGISVLDVDGMNKEAQAEHKSPGMLSRVFLGAKGRLEKFADNRRRFDKIMDEQEAIIRKTSADLKRNVASLVDMTQATKTGLAKLSIATAAAQIALDRGYENLIALRQQAIENNDPAKAADVMVLRGRLADFEDKTSELRYALVRSSGLLPNIAATSRVTESRIQKLSSSILLTLPALKSAAALAVAQLDAASARASGKALDDADAAILRLSADGSARALENMSKDRGVSANRIAALAEAVKTTTDAIEQSIIDDSKAQDQSREQEEQMIAISQQMKDGMQKIAQTNLNR